MTSKYENDVPITCRWTILDLLYHRCGDHSIRTLSRWEHAPEHVTIERYRDFGDSEYRHYLVDPATVDAMLADRLLEGKKCWGYTQMRELHISDGGVSELWRQWESAGGADLYGHSTGKIPPAEYWLERQA